MTSISPIHSCNYYNNETNEGKVVDDFLLLVPLRYIFFFPSLVIKVHFSQPTSKWWEDEMWRPKLFRLSMLLVVPAVSSTRNPFEETIEGTQQTTVAKILRLRVAVDYLQVFGRAVTFTNQGSSWNANQNMKIHSC
jgi:hypothetical protein